MDKRSLEIEGTTPLLKNRSFRRLWAAQFCAVTVIYGLSLAGAVLVEERTQSSAQSGLVILSAILPAFLASLVAGTVVDQWGRVRGLMVSHLARALVALAFWGGTELLPSGLALTTVYTVNVAGAIFTQFAMPAELALLPDLVDPAHLTSANALIQLGTLIAEGLGIVFLSPLVIKLAGAPAMGLVGAGLCLSALALVAALPKDQPSTGPAKERGVVWAELGADLQAGWHTIARDRLLTLVTVQATLAATLLLVLLSLVPGLVSRHLGLRVEDAPFLMLPGGLGFVLGAILMNRWEGRLSRPAWIAVGLISLGSSISLLGALSGEGVQSFLRSTVPFALWLILLPILGVGLALALIIIPARIVLQERPPAPLRGRVIAAQLALGNAAAVIPLLLGGSLADRLGIRPVMGLLSLLAMGAGVAGLHRVRS
jgi:MFS family permease